MSPEYLQIEPWTDVQLLSRKFLGRVHQLDVIGQIARDHALLAEPTTFTVTGLANASTLTPQDVQVALGRLRACGYVQFEGKAGRAYYRPIESVMWQWALTTLDDELPRLQPDA